MTPPCCPDCTGSTGAAVSSQHATPAAAHLSFQGLPDSCGLGVQRDGILQGYLERLQPSLADLLDGVGRRHLHAWWLASVTRQAPSPHQWYECDVKASAAAPVPAPAPVSADATAAALGHPPLLLLEQEPGLLPHRLPQSIAAACNEWCPSALTHRSRVAGPNERRQGSSSRPSIPTWLRGTLERQACQLSVPAADCSVIEMLS